MVVVVFSLSLSLIIFSSISSLSLQKERESWDALLPVLCTDLYPPDRDTSEQSPFPPLKGRERERERETEDGGGSEINERKKKGID